MVFTGPPIFDLGELTSPKNIEKSSFAFAPLLKEKNNLVVDISRLALLQDSPGERIRNQRVLSDMWAGGQRSRSRENPTFEGLGYRKIRPQNTSTTHEIGCFPVDCPVTQAFGA